MTLFITENTTMSNTDTVCVATKQFQRRKNLISLSKVHPSPLQMHTFLQQVVRYNILSSLLAAPYCKTECSVGLQLALQTKLRLQCPVNYTPQEKNNPQLSSYGQCMGIISYFCAYKTHVSYTFCRQPIYSPYHGYNYSYPILTYFIGNIILLIQSCRYIENVMGVIYVLLVRVQCNVCRTCAIGVSIVPLYCGVS